MILATSAGKLEAICCMNWGQKSKDARIVVAPVTKDDEVLVFFARWSLEGWLLR